MNTLHYMYNVHVHICVLHDSISSSYFPAFVHQASHMAYLAEMICLVFSAVGPPWSTRENYCLTVLYMRHLHVCVYMFIYCVQAERPMFVFGGSVKKTSELKSPILRKFNSLMMCRT